MLLVCLSACSDKKTSEKVEIPQKVVEEIQKEEPKAEQFQLTGGYLFKKIPESLENLEMPTSTVDSQGTLDYDDLIAMKNMGVKIAFDDEQKSYTIPDDIELKQLQQVTIIDFNGERLHEIPAWLAKFTNLKKLDLSNSYAPLKGIANIPNAPDLEILNLSNNHFFQKKYGSLEDVHLWLNFLQKIQNVRILDLSNTEGMEKYIPANLNYLPNLLELNLTGNNIQYNLAELGLNELENLTKLNLQNTSLKSGDVMKYLPRESLKELNLSNNSLENLNFHGGVPSLELLNLQGNRYLKMASEYEGAFHTKNLVQLIYDRSATIPVGLVKRLKKLRGDNESTNVVESIEQDVGETISVSNKRKVYIDKKQGIMWDKCSLGQVWQNDTCEGEAMRYPWEKAKQAVEQLNENNHLGYNNWRLPHIEELHSLIYCPSGFVKSNGIPAKRGGYKRVKEECQGNDYPKPTINQKNFPNTMKMPYWSASSYTENNINAWGVYFGRGVDSYYPKKDSHYVRIVRSLD